MWIENVIAQILYKDYIFQESHFNSNSSYWGTQHPSTTFYLEIFKRIRLYYAE